MPPRSPPSSPPAESRPASRLRDYAEKRTPEATPEPFGESPEAEASTREGVFVVHLHDATRRHFDFRLETAGVLSSFAVPHGPPIETTDKRLAIHTEDHPIEYLDFEGVIPDGNYGAGPMVVWDRGLVSYLETSIEEGVAAGKIDFFLRGHKLSGRFALVKIKAHARKENTGREWLLLKKAEGAEFPARDLDVEFPRSVLSGMRVDELERAEAIGLGWEARAGAWKQSARWEKSALAAPFVPVRPRRDVSTKHPTWDPLLGGARAILVKDDAGAHVHYDDGAQLHDVSIYYPELTTALRAHPLRALVLDGEIAAFDASGHASFRELAARIDKIRERGAVAAREVPVAFVALDLLAVGDHDIRAVPSRERRKLLAEVLPERGVLRASEPLDANESALLQLAVAHGLAGWIAREPTSAYAAGAWSLLVPEGAPPSVRALEHDVKRVKAASREVRVTNPHKVFFPDVNVTKGELIAYYAELSSQILPLIAERPLVLVRYPDGVNGKSFYQWNVPPGSPEWLESVTLEHSEKSDTRGFIARDRESLAYLANLGCIPIHMLACKRGNMDACDFFTVDFDVGASSLAHGITLATTLHEWLDAVGLESFPKTSGQTGLHVLVPLGEGQSFDTARGLADLFGTLLTRKHPELATIERVKDKRGPKVYVDTGQTGPTRSIVCPYSVRATALATVSMPLPWSAINETLDPKKYNVRTVPALVQEHGDAMAGFTKADVDLPRAMKALEKLVKDIG